MQLPLRLQLQMQMWATAGPWVGSQGMYGVQGTALTRLVEGMPMESSAARRALPAGPAGYTLASRQTSAGTCMYAHHSKHRLPAVAPSSLTWMKIPFLARRYYVRHLKYRAEVMGNF